MINAGDLGEHGPSGGQLLASIDVEWSKNYRIKNGNIPFCYSIVWIRMPARPVVLTEVTFGYLSRYVSSSEETQDLISAADTDFGHVLDTATLISGHQLSSDLATLINAARRPVPHIHAMRERWHGRRAPGADQLLDTRYDLDHLLTGTSRRLVDVATELQLDVTQPELRSTSMTALHRRWLANGDHQARERITVLNLRHGLSTALLALLGAHRGAHPDADAVNVNQLLHRQLTGYAWLNSPTFTNLL